MEITLCDSFTGKEFVESSRYGGSEDLVKPTARQHRMKFVREEIGLDGVAVSAAWLDLNAIEEVGAR